MHADALEPADAGVPRRDTERTRRVVIIEDNADAAEALAVYLQRIGHDVTVARDGRAGLDAVERHRPHVVICDIGLPELDGYEVARRLLAQGLTTAVRADCRDRLRRRRRPRPHRAAGFSHHLTKPADPEVLARLVDRATPRLTRQGREHARSQESGQ